MDFTCLELSDSWSAFKHCKAAEHQSRLMRAGHDELLSQFDLNVALCCGLNVACDTLRVR